MKFRFKDGSAIYLNDTIKSVSVEGIGAYLNYAFPEDKKAISKLSYDGKMEWYAHQFQADPYKASIVFSTPEFKSFWKWHVLIPMKLKRFYYRLKNLEMFKKHPHITEIRAAKIKKSIKQYMI